MLLTYSNTRFPVLIEQGIKIHTIRLDLGNRWKPGMQIHHWMHNPRNVSKNPYPFCQDLHHLVSRQQISIEPDIKMVRIDGKRFLTDEEIDDLAYNDGLQNRRVFFKWFNESFSGYILHWTNKKY
jgi:hypothetical protein